MKPFKQQCIELRKKDLTLNEIVELTGRSKTTVYFHIKDIPLSDNKQREINENSRARALLAARARKGVSERQFTVFSEWTPELVLLVAHLMFDGEILRQKCIYNNRAQVLTKRVSRLMKLIYEFKPLVRDDQSGVRRVQYHNVALASFLHDKAMELTHEIIHLPRECQREFIRAFFDDEGCIDVRLDRHTRRVRGYQKDQKILLLIKKLLANFSIEATLQGKNEIVIRGRENLMAFQKEINFSKGVRMNPNRTNSVWKQDIEKRVLLDRAIKSFQTKEK